MANDSTDTAIQSSKKRIHTPTSVEGPQPQNKNSKKQHEECHSNVPSESRRKQFEHLLVESNILDRRDKVKLVIDYIEEFGLLKGQPIMYKMRFESAVTTIRSFWNDRGVVPFMYFIRLFEEDSKRYRRVLWFDIKDDGKSQIQRDEWLEDLDLWMSGCKTLKAFVEVMGLSQHDLIAEAGGRLFERLKFQDFTLHTLLEDALAIVEEAVVKNNLTLAEKRYLQELYAPFFEYLTSLIESVD